MKYPLTVHQQILDLCNRIEGLPTQYALLPDAQLVELSAFLVVLKEGLCNFTDPYKEVRAVLDRMDRHPFCAIYAELVRRILSGQGDKALLLHALYRQAVCAPQEGYGEYGEEEWICSAVFDTIDGRGTEAGSQYDYATLDLLQDTFHLLGEFEAEDEACLKAVLAQWEKGEVGWHSLPAYDLAQRLRIATASNGLSSSDLMDPVPASVHLLESFTPYILDGADASGLIAYREALRNTYCFGAVSTEYFSALEQKAGSMPDGGFSLELLQGMLLVDRMEREQADLVCPVQN